MFIYINQIMKNQSLCDGPGYRTVLFLQGCNLKCKGCHNTKSWKIEDGTKMEVSELASILREKAFNKKITISGGEPLLQQEALIVLLKELEGYDICLYTGHEYDEVPKEVLKYLRYIKTGPYISELKTTTIPYVGSSNQKLVEVKHE